MQVPGVTIITQLLAFEVGLLHPGSPSLVSRPVAARRRSLARYGLHQGHFRKQEMGPRVFLSGPNKSGLETQVLGPNSNETLPQAGGETIQVARAADV